jgi:hypothetical protein
VFVLAELLDELAEVYEQLGRTDDALEAIRAAIEAGYRGQPDPRCRIAEINLRAGRTQPAPDIFAAVKPTLPTMCGLSTTPGWNTVPPVTTPVLWSG